MDLGDLIRDESEAYIRAQCTETLKKPAFIQFFLNHEHLKELRKNLRLQIFGAELKFGVEMDVGRVRKIIRAGVDVFMHAALEQAKLNHMSQAERKRLEDMAGKEKAAAEWYEDQQRDLKSTAISASMYTPGQETKKHHPPQGS